MDLRKLKTLIDLVSDSNVSELEITEAEGKVRIVKGGIAAPVNITPRRRSCRHRRLPPSRQRQSRLRLWRRPNTS